MSEFRPSSKFKQQYKTLFRENPEGANLFLLLAELSEDQGQIETTEAELAALMAIRFDNPMKYALEG